MMNGGPVWSTWRGRRNAGLRRFTRRRALADESEGLGGIPAAERQDSPEVVRRDGGTGRRRPGGSPGHQLASSSNAKSIKSYYEIEGAALITNHGADKFSTINSICKHSAGAQSPLCGDKSRLGLKNINGRFRLCPAPHISQTGMSSAAASRCEKCTCAWKMGSRRKMVYDGGTFARAILPMRW
jgi:hypothetical protein